jgi:hypothetical protein
MKTFTLLAIAGLLSLNIAPCSAKDALKECWKQQAEPLQHQYLNISYNEKQNELYHSPEPWMQIGYTGNGKIWYGAEHFARQDTFTIGKRKLHAKLQLHKNELLFADYGHEDLSDVTPDVLFGHLLETARYEPTTLVQYFSDRKVSGKKQAGNDLMLYQIRIYQSVVCLYIRSSDNLVEKITVLSNDDLHGDVLTAYIYSNYTHEGKLSYPKNVSIEKLNGKVHDEVSISDVAMVSDMPALLTRPKDYAIKEKPIEKTDISVEHYNEHIHFVNMRHVGIKAMVAEFNDFVLVTEAPLNNTNGELLIAEVRKIAPGKATRYFSFGHHHPHYLGGMRSFIHKGATVLTAKDDIPYLNYLANAAHSLKPDSLQLSPRSLNLQEIDDSITITDGTYAMNIYHIGQKSGHTSDYLIYYFPEEKLLFEGDLVWIASKGDLQKAGPTQAGLYNAIKDLNLNVKTIVQSWNISSEKYKMQIPFEELEQSVSIK